MLLLQPHAVSFKHSNSGLNSHVVVYCFFAQISLLQPLTMQSESLAHSRNGAGVIEGNSVGYGEGVVTCGRKLAAGGSNVAVWFV